MTRLRVWRSLECMMARWKCPRRTLAMHPGFPVLDDLSSRNVVADEVHELSFRSRDDLLKCLEHECIDQQMIHGRKVGSERHVIQVRVGFRRPQRRVDQLAILARQRQSPSFEETLEFAKLVCGQVVAKPARSAVREKRQPLVAQPKNFGRASSTIIVPDFHRLAFAKMVSTPIATQ